MNARGRGVAVIVLAAALQCGAASGRPAHDRRLRRREAGRRPSPAPAPGGIAGRRSRCIRRTPDVMREDAARMKRGDLFSTWSNAAAN